MARKVAKKAEASSKPELTQPEAVLHRSQSSVSLKRDSKGVHQYEIKAYADDPDEAVQRASDMAESMEVFLGKLKQGKE